MLQNDKKKLLKWQENGVLGLIEEYLNNDEILITATDTIPGFLASLSKESFEELNRLKGNRTTKPYLVLTGSWENLPLFVPQESISDNAWKLINHTWDAPVTFVFNARHDLPAFLTSHEKTIALRRPQHEQLLMLLKKFDGLFSTSANQSNQPTPISFEALDPVIVDQVTALVENEKQQVTAPSTILDLTQSETGTITVLREGTYTVQQLEGLYDFSFKRP